MPLSKQITAKGFVCTFVKIIRVELDFTIPAISVTTGTYKDQDTADANINDFLNTSVYPVSLSEQDLSDLQATPLIEFAEGKLKQHPDLSGAVDVAIDVKSSPLNL